MCLVCLCIARAGLAQTAASLNLSMDLPDGWRIANTPQGVLLMPSDLKSGPAGQDEMYLVSVLAAPANASLRDPNLAQAMVAQMVGQFQGYSPASEPQACSVAGEPGIRLILAGADRASGRPMMVGIWFTVGRGRLIMLTGVGSRDAVSARVNALDQISAQLKCSTADVGTQHAQQQQGQQLFGAANPNADPALVGVWQCNDSSSYVSPSYGAGESFALSTVTVTTMYFNPDGSGLQNVRSQIAGGTESQAYDSGQDRGNNYPFTWAAGGGVLRMHTVGGPGELRYQVSRDTLITIGPKGHRTVYRRVG
jgi:hypothetical protein